jgi:hypothetical protein
MDLQVIRLSQAPTLACLFRKRLRAVAGVYSKLSAIRGLRRILIKIYQVMSHCNSLFHVM